MLDKDELGRRGEQLAVDHLSRAGYRILDRNWRCPRGELDVVAVDRRELVVVEVKTRSGLRYGHPLEAITRQKLTRLHLLAGLWRDAHGWSGRRGARIDVVAILLPEGGAPSIDHVKAIVR